MTLQWTAVALFLYGEIGLNLLFCLPFISAQRWRSVFGWRLWSWFSPYWNRGFYTMIMVLILLFLDAARDVHKYSGPQSSQDAQANPNLLDHLHMRLFRAQRNLYISGFSLFLWLIMRRVVTLLNHVAVTTENNAGLQAQMDGAHQAANQTLEDNLLLRRALVDEEKSKSSANQHLKTEAEKLRRELKAADDAVRKSHTELEAMKRQSKGLTQEYDRLLREHTHMQNLQNTADKKDQ